MNNIIDFTNQGKTTDRLQKIRDINKVQTDNEKAELLKEPDEAKLSEMSNKILEKQIRTSFDYKLLPPVLSNYVNELTCNTSADPTMITQSVICMLSSMIGKRVVIPYPVYFQDLYPNLWCLTLNESGSFKTTALNIGSRIAKHKGKEIDFEIVELQRELNSLEKTTKEDLKKYNNMIREKVKENPILPERTTAEALASIIDTNGGSEHTGGQVMCSEFADWTRNFERSHNNGYKQLLTSLYDVPDVWKYSTKTGGTMVLTKPFITINAVSTLEWVSKDISQDDVGSGFFARFLLFYPPAKKEIPPALPMYSRQDHYVENEIKEILNRIRENPLFREYRLTQEGEGCFQYIHDEIYNRINALPDNLSKKLQPYVKRWSPYVLKIASLFQPFFNFESQELENNTIMSAAQVVYYCIDSTISLFENELGESEQQKKQRVIMEYIAKKGGSITRQTLISSKSLTGSVIEYENVINTLIESGKIVVSEKSKKTEWLYSLVIQ